MENAITTLTGPTWNGVRYFSTQLQGGFSQGPWQGLNLGEHCGDCPQHVAQNRALLRQSLPSEPHWLRQVHGTDIYQAMAPAQQALLWDQAPAADAAWTTTKQTVLAVLTADCLPVVIADTQGRVVGVAHAGWRGLAAGVLEKLFLKLKRQLPNNTKWNAWIGPAISQNYFEVGADVYNDFNQINTNLAPYFIYNELNNKYYADLAGMAKFLLLRQDSLMQVSLSNACTYAESDRYYSYRRQGKTGRIVTIAWLI